ncbi:hypothetical protein H6G33_36495 [Calothrix sp. FACHB-1219]|uniref:hypothetical protein n=1 Tax=unclassified Calothrix TaxID=2619626 RepID=UPI001683D7D4|nr:MULTISPECIES: hypothetical protein [unclassified Calothrix]MBD2207831.1 hypothetical protein [Calothrix sp. FACHB-168]MBD2222433.1 hypothetical protein [Calothrix sp. FACHB-1219]
MTNQSLSVIEVEATEITEQATIETQIESESKQSDLLDNWVLSAVARELTRLDKSAFQRAITSLIENYKVPVDLLRRGEGKNTQYSGYAVKLVKAVRSADKTSIESLLKFSPKPTQQANCSALATVNKNNQLARQSDAKTVENFTQAKQNLNAGLQNWRMLGASLAAKVSKEIKAGFAEQFNSEMQDLGVQAQDVFNLD